MFCNLNYYSVNWNYWNLFYLRIISLHLLCIIGQMVLEQVFRTAIPDVLQSIHLLNCMCLFSSLLYGYLRKCLSTAAFPQPTHDLSRNMKHPTMSFLLTILWRRLVTLCNKKRKLCRGQVFDKTKFSHCPPHGQCGMLLTLSSYHWSLTGTVQSCITPELQSLSIFNW